MPLRDEFMAHRPLHCQQVVSAGLEGALKEVVGWWAPQARDLEMASEAESG